MSQLRIKNEKARQDKERLAPLKVKHAGKKEHQITTVDVLEWAKSKMLEELGIRP